LQFGWHFSQAIGGGVYGLVPNYLYRSDCSPPNGTTAPDTLCRDNFNNGAPVVLGFYGPILPHGTGSPIKMQIYEVNGAVADIPSSQYTTAISGRTLTISRAPGTPLFIAARYRVQLSDTVNDRPVCDKTFVTNPPAVHEFVYEFGLLCNWDNLGGCDDPACPFAAFCFFGDFNMDGGRDGADVEAFFTAFDAGDPAADVNLDGGVTGDDVTDFFCVWEAGC